MRVRMTRPTIHGNPGERRLLPVGALAVAVPADNLPPTTPASYWVGPLIDGGAGGWDDSTARWARDVGCLVNADDFTPIGEGGGQ